MVRLTFDRPLRMLRSPPPNAPLYISMASRLRVMYCTERLNLATERFTYTEPKASGHFYSQINSSILYETLVAILFSFRV